MCTKTVNRNLTTLNYFFAMNMFSTIVTLFVLCSFQVTGVFSDYMFVNSTHVDCNGVLTENTIKGSVSCCGSEAYDSQLQVCCSELQRVAYKLARDGSSHSPRCCEDPVSKGVTAYDSRFSVCCLDGSVLEVGEEGSRYRSCCGGLLLDTRTSFCCDQHPFDRSYGLHCCAGQELYDPQDEICASYFDKERNKQIYEVKPRENEHISACKLELYDVLTAVCCDGAVVNKSESLLNAESVSCCRSTPYDRSSHLCCPSGDVIARPIEQEYDSLATCCNQRVFTNHSWQMCCMDTVVDRLEMNRGGCCGSKLVTGGYESSCCAANPIEASEVYNMTSQLCCQGHLFPKSTPFASCCLTGAEPVTYDIRDKFCGPEGLRDNYH